MLHDAGHTREMGTNGGERYQRAPSWAGLAEVESWEESQRAGSRGYGDLQNGSAAGELCQSPMLRTPDQHDFAEADEDSNEGLPDLGQLLGEKAWVSRKMSWASIVEKDRTATRTASLTVKLDSPSINTVSWADSLEVCV